MLVISDSSPYEFIIGNNVVRAHRWTIFIGLITKPAWTQGFNSSLGADIVQNYFVITTPLGNLFFQIKFLKRN